MSSEIKADYIPSGVLDHYVKNEASETWYPTGQVFEAWGTSGRAATDYAVAMVGDVDGHFVGDFDTNTSAGHYYITAKIRAGANAANDDSVLGSEEIWWNGTSEETESEYELNAYGANTVVPDAAGTAAGLHSTTDGLINTISAITDKLDTTLELDGAVYRFTENALEQGSATVTTVTWTVQATVAT